MRVQDDRGVARDVGRQHHLPIVTGAEAGGALDGVVLAGQTAEQKLKLPAGQVQRRLQAGPVCAGHHVVKIRRLAVYQRHG